MGGIDDVVSSLVSSYSRLIHDARRVSVTGAKQIGRTIRFVYFKALESSTDYLSGA